MKKKTNKKKVPAYAFGIDQGLEIASILGAGLQGFTEEGSGADIAGSTLGGAAKGASVGSVILPGIGTAVGGVVGGVGNLVSGIFRKNAINKQKRIKANAKEIAMGKGNAATLEQEYWNDNSLAYTFENGGILPDLAFVDNNEVIRDDSGNIIQVPNNKPGTDNHLIDASNLESVLSDRIKRPGTNRTFAQEGEKLTKMTKKSKGNDIFAKNTDMLNKRNANAMYEQLLTEQEAVKAKKGIKPKVKGIPAYADGKGDWTRQLGKSITNWGDQVMNYLNGINWTENLVPKSGPAPGRTYVYNNDPVDNSVDAITGETIRVPDAAPIPKVKSVRKHTPASKSTKAINPLNQAPLLNIEDFNPSLAPDPIYAPLLSIEDFNPSLAPDPIYAPLLSIEDFNPTLTPDEIKTPSKSSFNFGSLSGLSPILYNWVQSRRRPEVEDQVINPYTGAINRAMASRKLNIEPTLAANRRSRAIARNNMARLNPNTGMNLAYGNQLATGEYAQNTSVYANRDNANNQYLGEYANMMNNLGQQYVQNTVLTNDLNARNRAAARNFGATAAGQLGQWSQTKEKMRNQARRDRQILPYLQNFLRYGTVNSLVDSLTV